MRNNTFRQVRLVTAWEFMHFFKWKQEIISKLIMLAIAAIVFVWQTVKDDSDPSYWIGVVSENSEIAIPSSIGPFEFETAPGKIDELLELLDDEPLYDAVIELKVGEKGKHKVKIHSSEKTEWLNDLQQTVSQHYSQLYAQQLGLELEQLSLLSEPVLFEQLYTDDNVKEDEKESSVTAIGMAFLLMAGVFTAFAQIFASITGEKQQRVTEQLYSCITAQTWIDGKILGNLLHGLKAMFTMSISGILGYTFIQVVIAGEPLSFGFIDWSMLPWLIVFALAGLYFCTAFMAAIAAAIDDPNHSAKTSLMLLPLVPVILTLMTMGNPSGFAFTFLSYFPLTAFAAMPIKMSLIEVAIWEPLVALSLIFLLCYWIRGSAGRLFKMGMIMYGKEPSLKDMLKWAFKGK
jgi:ABC-2 type transport system permease protein